MTLRPIDLKTMCENCGQEYGQHRVNDHQCPDPHSLDSRGWHHGWLPTCFKGVHPIKVKLPKIGWLHESDGWQWIGWGFISLLAWLIFSLGILTGMLITSW